MKFYRLMLFISAGLLICVAIAHMFARRADFVAADAVILALTAFYYFVLRYPKRLIYRFSQGLLAISYLMFSVMAFHIAAAPSSIGWSVAGAVSSIALLGSVNSAMLLGHWYLVVRGMSIDPLKRLTIALLVSTILKALVVTVAALSLSDQGLTGGLHQVAISQGIFFWMRIGWGLAGPLMLFPLVWGTVKIRSTMAATGILYVVVVAVVIGEVLGTYLSASHHLPL